jgi:hypothetical protein
VRNQPSYTPEYTPLEKHFADGRKAANGLDVTAKVIGRAVLWTVKAAAMAACLAVGVELNYEVANGESVGWLAFSVITLPLASASVIVATSNRLNAHERLFGAVLAIAFIGMNSLTHLSNSASSHDRERDRSGYEFQEKTRVDARLKELDAARAEQVAIAGNAAVSATRRSSPDRNTEGCGQASATDRDKIDAERKTLAAKDVRPVRSRIDSQITAIVNTLAVFGVTVNDKKREWIASARPKRWSRRRRCPITANPTLDWVRVGVLELISSFGPKLLLLLFAVFDPRRTAEKRNH